jgi:hypothetical protein
VVLFGLGRILGVCGEAIHLHDLLVVDELEDDVRRALGGLEGLARGEHDGALCTRRDTEGTYGTRENARPG